MKILVTGGGGFLGKALVLRLLARGDTVRVFTRSAQPALEQAGAVCFRGDIAAIAVANAAAADIALIRAACEGCDAVFHTAAKTGVWGRADEFFRVNTSGTQNVLDACRAAAVPLLVHTSTPSVVYTGGPLAGASETLPLATSCPCAYPPSKAEAERRVLAANCATLRTTALRPHLIWGAGDPHLVPRVVRQARTGRLRIVGDGQNRVDLTHIDNAVHAHLLALDALRRELTDGSTASATVRDSSETSAPKSPAGRAYFISDGAPVVLWEWVNALLARLGIAPVTRRIRLTTARRAGALAECLWRVLPLRGEPPMTRFVATELAEDHWFDISAARRDLGYAPVADPAAALDALVASL
ncbi:MAG: NAD-dependent epimerase/dehydratase family protein [Puniceicoccales bacterium]|jgi:nucleoside-diphosphate-sugar epimerase|nr:NAD-dependent epimerase/dehydratase family protein [Puniceicoccales bacterium]